MKASGVLFLMLPLLVVFSLPRFSDAADATEVQDNLKGFSDKNNPVLDSNRTQISPPVKIDKERKDGDQDKGLQEETKKGPEKDDSKKSSDEKKDKQLQEPKAEDNNGKQRSDKDSDSKQLPVVDSHVEECDPSNRCIDEESKFIACLRVPGKDSLALSLLIQNKGTGSLDVNIVAPSFVNLDPDKVLLPANENKEVKVSVSDGTSDTTIILKAGKGHCSLNLRNMISSSVRRSEASKLSGFINIPLRASIIFVLMATVVLIGAAWLCIRYRQMYHQEDGLKYQKVEVALPVSTGGKKETDEADGWNNNWEDGWDDEEAPKTPSNLLSNPSSKGLASRRLNKDSWKD
ncbi:uncharacterized protein [Elaeis guineensis]|uniref:Uncharacterized protein LOC105039323 n=1 Tax=Elaeis guineensis var. tenera TaxID=51953 RepID=A0A6I9QRJ9_ELAGV|nr:uncharacterized protein LOC105039323 [Elaeis guineensis]